MTELKIECLADSTWNEHGVDIPHFDVGKIRKKTSDEPEWIHFGGGNIFRVYIARLQQMLIESGDSEKGIIVADNFDPDIIEKIYKPYDMLTLAVRMDASGEMKKEVIASVSEALHCNCEYKEDWNRLKEIFRSPSLKICSFTITEKGYALKKTDGSFMDNVASDMERGIDTPVHLMAQITALLYERFSDGAAPISVVSMDNCSCNGKVLKDAVMAIADAWMKKGYISQKFIDYLNDEERVSFPWSMIDKITPRPADRIKTMLEEEGFENMDILCTRKGTYMAPFVNTEKAEYLIIEDSFPAGRPALEKSGVIFTDRETVQKTERMKVMTCLNPLHTALAVFGCLLGYKSIAEEMSDIELKKMVEIIGYREGMPVVTDPGIINPKDFMKEVLNERFPNINIPDTPQRIATDTSQKIPVRFGETLKAYMADDKLAITELKMIPLVIAAWIRYLMGVDDSGRKMEVSPDPLLEEFQKDIESITFGDPASLTDQLKTILCNEMIFGINLYKAGLGEKIENTVRDMIAEPGAVRKTLAAFLEEGEIK